MTGKFTSLAAALAGFLLVFAAAGVLYYWTYSRLAPALPGSPETVPFELSEGQSAAFVANQLYNLGLIRSSLAARIYLKFTGLDYRLRPGPYQLSPALGTSDIFAVLTQGPSDIRVTFPEGWRREQIAVRLQGTLRNFDTQLFLSQTASLEGQLFPDTYLFPANADATKVVDIMLTNFRRKSGLILPDQAEALIMASLVEREAKNDTDRPLISGILFKRLRNQWPLQVDATVQYARDSENCKLKIENCKFWGEVSDTKFSSQFNTYLHPGLPPAPIANPGASAIRAAVSPQDSPHWYYLAGPDGVTRFAETLSGHNLNIDKYLRP